MCIQQRRVDHHSCAPQARPSTSSAVNTVYLPWRNVLRVQRLEQNFRENYHYSGGTRISLQHDAVHDMRKKARSSQLASTELRLVKTQTRTDGDGIYCYRASIASRRAVTRVGTGMGSVPLASTPPGMPGTHPPQYFGWWGRQREYPRQYYYVLSDIADHCWLPYVRSASSRFHSAIRRHQFASVRQADSRLTRLVPPPNLELALTPLLGAATKNRTTD